MGHSHAIWREWLYKAKSRKYRGVFKMKSREKTHVRENWFQYLEHKQVQKRARNQMSGRVDFPYCHATPVENDQRKLLVIQ